ncbi:MAG: hypothetical protein QM808_06245 [Steroidobacteraceae bacterium]
MRTQAAKRRNSKKTAGPSFKDKDDSDEDDSEELDEDGNPIPKREAEERKDNTLASPMEAALKPKTLKFPLIATVQRSRHCNRSASKHWH